MRLEPLLQAGELRDLRIGIEVSWKTQTNTEPCAAQEFDVALTDGRRLFILECKAGRVLPEDIYKLENSVRNYGGAEARGMLVSAFQPAAAAKQRLQGAKNLIYLYGDRVASELDEEIFKALGSV